MTLYFVFHLFLAYDSLYLISDSPGSFHVIDSYYQYDVTVYVSLPILSTPVVVYKSGILGTQSPRLDFTCNMVLVN